MMKAPEDKSLAPQASTFTDHFLNMEHDPGQGAVSEGTECFYRFGGFRWYLRRMCRNRFACLS